MIRLLLRLLKQKYYSQIIAGQISPPLEGVIVQIFGKDKETPIHTLVTQKDGTYNIGPLDGKIGYRYNINIFSVNVCNVLI